MPHERLADFLHHSRLHESRVEGMAEVVEAEVPDSRPADGGLPSGLDQVNGPALIGEEKAFLLSLIDKELVDSLCEWDLAGFSFGCFRTRDIEQLARKIHVFPELLKNLATTHSGVDRERDDLTEMRGGRLEQLGLVVQTQHQSRFSPNWDQADAAQWIGG